MHCNIWLSMPFQKLFQICVKKKVQDPLFPKLFDDVLNSEQNHAPLRVKMMIFEVKFPLQLNYLKKIN